MTEKHPLQPQQIFAGRYRIERFLAEGGMGAVFVGEHLATEQRVAVKVLWPHVLSSRAAVETFQLEAKVAGRVASDHIVRVIDAGFDEQTRMPFLVMELLVGQTLASVVESSGPLPPALVYEYLRQVAAGLDKAHDYTDKDGVRRPIVHRDLKPENLFLSRRESGEPLLKILDFGIAKVVSGDSGHSREIKGTPLFMASEQAGARPTSPQTDIWALGLIAFWLLSGRHYWRSAQPHAEGGLTPLFAEVLALPLEAPSKRAVELGFHAPFGPAFDGWFFNCVNRDPAHRFASAGAAIEALGSALSVSRGGQQLEAVAQSQQLQPRPPRRRSLPLVGGLGLLLVAGAAAALWLRPSPAPVASTLSAEPRATQPPTPRVEQAVASAPAPTAPAAPSSIQAAPTPAPLAKKDVAKPAPSRAVVSAAAAPAAPTAQPARPASAKPPDPYGER